MAVDFNKFGKSTSVTQQTPQTTGATSTIPPQQPSTGGKIDFNKFGKAGGTQTAPITQAPEEDGFVKSLVRPVATMVARPVQLGAAIAGVDEDTLDKFSKEKLGGYVAPVVRGQGEYGIPSLNDMTKEVGRAVQTVALGVGPIGVGGAAFGLGGSMENQGGKIFTPEGALEAGKDTAIGYAGGKLLKFAGVPLINKVSGQVAKYSPQFINDLASKGAGAVEKFMAEHELPIVGGVSKPLSEAIVTGANKLEAGTDKLFTGAAKKTGQVIQSQYPGASTEGLEKRFVKSEQDMFLSPIKSTDKAYAIPNEIYKDAKARGINLEDEIVKNKIFSKDMTAEGKYHSGSVDAIRQDAINTSKGNMRPALEQAEGSTRRIPVPEVKQRMLSEVDRMPDTEFTAGRTRADVKADIENLYGDGSAEYVAKPDGYSLTNLHDSKIANDAEVRYSKAGEISEMRKAKMAKLQADTFRKLLEETAPKELNVKAFNKEVAGKFALANYLEAMNGKNVPVTWLKHGIRAGARVGGFIAGSTMGGGYLSGLGLSHLSSEAVKMFENASSPIKVKILKDMKISEPKVFQDFKKYIIESKNAKESRLLLKEAGVTDKEIQKLVNEKGAIPMNPPASKGVTPGERIANDFKQNSRIFGNTKALPAPVPRIITPNKQGTPNPIGRPYSPKEKGDVGGMRQRVPKTEKEMQNSRESLKKRLFTSDIKASEPVVNKTKEPVKEIAETSDERKTRISKMVSDEKLKSKEKTDYLMKHGTMVGFGDKNPEKTISEVYAKRKSDSSGKKLSQEELDHLFKKKTKKSK